MKSSNKVRIDFDLKNSLLLKYDFPFYIFNSLSVGIFILIFLRKKNSRNPLPNNIHKKADTFNI